MGLKLHLTAGAGALLLSLLSTAAHALDGGQSVDVHLLTPLPEATSASVHQSADQDIEIHSIRVSGNARLDDGIVLSGLTIKQGDVLVGNYTQKLNEAAEALYDTGWYRSRPELTLDTLDGRAAVLNVSVYEMPLYRGTRLTGHTLFTEERLLQEFEGAADGSGARLALGEVVNLRRVIAGIDSILGVYQAAGYVGVQVENYQVVPAGPDEGIVEVAISEGMLEEIIIVGNDRTSERIIRAQITNMEVGQVLRRTDVERDLNQIYNTGLFHAVTPNPEPSLTPGMVKMVVEVEEAPTGQAGVGLGYSTVNGLQGTLNYAEKNLFGEGKSVNGQLIFSRNRPGFEINVSNPYQGKGFWSAGIFNLHSRQQRFPGSPYESELEIETKGAQVGYGQRVNDTDTWQTAFTVTDYDYTIRKGDPFRGLTPRQRARLSAQGQTRKLGFGYAHDTRNNRFDSTNGILLQANMDVAGFGGDFNFNKYTLEGREFERVGPGTLAMRQRIGTSTGTLPIYEEYRLGGVNSVRGHIEDVVTGGSSLLTNFEYRMPLSDMFGVVGFFDAGWAGESLSSMDFASGAGLGARIKIRALGIGAVRLDYGWALAGADASGGGGKFHFFLGEMF